MDIVSENNLKGVHPDLVRVVRRAHKDSGLAFRVIEGLRTLERQKKLKERGASKTLNSRHLSGHAVDIVPLDENGKVSWDWPLYHPLAKAIKAAAKAEKVDIEWGGDWKRFVDGPHWQLPWNKYPAGAPHTIEPPMTDRKKSDMLRSRTVQGGAVAFTVGTAEMVTQLQQADESLSTGTILGYIGAALIILASLYVLYARWDDGGRPLPGRD